jgi:hypothetical protein
MEPPPDGRVDGAFHSPAFLQAHFQSLAASERITFDDFKAKQQTDAQSAFAKAEAEERAQRALFCR